MLSGNIEVCVELLYMKTRSVNVYVSLFGFKVRIGAMLAYTPLDEKSLALLLSYLQDFLKWVFIIS